MGFFAAIRRVWRSLDYVPNCRACGGTGNVNPKWRAFAEQVYWKGQLYTVCHNCKGTGKV